MLSKEEKFIRACEHGSLDYVKEVYSTGVDINCKDRHRNTVFLLACCRKNLDVAKWLLSVADGKIDIEEKNGRGYTPFMVACIMEEDLLPAAKWLYSINPDCINTTTAWGDTVLLTTLKYKKHNAFRWLLSIGADMDANDGEIYRYIVNPDSWSKVDEDMNRWVCMHSPSSDGTRFGSLVDYLERKNAACMEEIAALKAELASVKAKSNS